MYIKKMTKPLLVTLIALGFIFTGHTGFARFFHGSIAFSMGFPQGEFKDNVDHIALGVDLTFGIKLGKSPFMLGLDLGVLNYGSDRRCEYLYGVPEFQFKVIHDYNLLQGLVFLRFQPAKNARVRPYIDALAGFNYLWSDTSLDDHGDEEITLAVNYDDFAFSYGLGGGVLVKLGRKRPRRVEFFIDLRARYIFGGKAEYLTEGSILVDEQEVTYLVYESRTDLLTFQIGFGLNF
ncbi:MAG: hypothetical protein PVH61_36355 [Candidatus Aminicenantes bacterium]|jgi:hypothetical protein